MGAWEQSQFTTRVANSQHSHLRVRTTVTTPTPQPTRSPHPPNAKRIPSHLAPSSCTPRGRMEWGGTPPPRPFALQLVLRQRLAIPLPHPRGPLLLAPLHTPIGCKLFEGQILPPSGFFSAPQESPSRTPHHWLGT